MTASRCSSPTGAAASPRTLTSSSPSRAARRATSSRSAGSTTRAPPTPPQRRSDDEAAQRDIFWLVRAGAGRAGFCLARGCRRQDRSGGGRQGVQEVLLREIPQAEAGRFRQRSLFDGRGPAQAVGGEGAVPPLRVRGRGGQGNVHQAVQERQDLRRLLPEQGHR